jgi:hypothetical protein
MPFNLLTTIVLALLGGLASAAPAFGQWILSAEVGADRFWGGSAERGTGSTSFRPYRPTTFGVGVQQLSRNLGFGLRIRYASAGLALEGTDAVAAIKGVFTVFSVTPEFTYRLATMSAGSRLVLHAGPLAEVWSIRDEESRTRVGIQAALSLRVPLGGRFSASFDAGAAVTPSPFTSDQLETGYEPRALWRRRMAGGLGYRL